MIKCICGTDIPVPDQFSARQIACPECGKRHDVTHQPRAVEPVSAERGSLAGQVCSVCQTRIGGEEQACLCPECRTPYHHDCWAEIGGCAIYGCKLMPAIAKAENGATAATEAWGDEKICPACQKQIKSAALKCRFCRASFPSALPMEPLEYKRWRNEQAEVGPTRKGALMLFIFSLLGCSSPLVLLIGGFWLKRNYDTLHRIGGVHEALAWFGLGISGLWLFILFMVMLL